MSSVPYGKIMIHPRIPDIGPIAKVSDAIWTTMSTKHEGDVLYYKLWNFWVRAGAQAVIHDDVFFRNYETANADTDALLSSIGFPWKKAETEEAVWQRVGMVWNWLKAHVVDDEAGYSSISSVPEAWPSILDYAKYYAVHGKLVWAACFSKAHLFATLLGRMAYPRFRFGVAEAHHTEGGAPPTATHVYVGVYIAGRWYYLDPTAVPLQAFPDFAHRKSVGLFGTVDYEHPYSFLPVPLSGFNHVPYLPA
jgi:hypothetical protein